MPLISDTVMLMRHHFFQVHIFDTQQELERFTQEARHRAPHAGGDSTLQSTRMGEATMDFNSWHR